ncbi:hypothetical protein COY16_06225 [Candidatus Roizmanbacteria bacterium CG_4_10_14_0_2_um_filter_39_13]|uniref:Radical SAM core domain-containing protein n=1 Tax=Candidatus Roizmanbacteria bacterium CG_4_10_14_0_2_um_filter_39_13 TaxID=1974825 RepID=A0A2M7TV67_9BACT|nr:MAG: hypothetical protein COY16_06225 [Candidatus Roizmanbacteria bacterium CG_4_10_14_0_2_um_filter_39_13]
MKKLTVLLLNPPYSEPILRDNYCCFTSKTGYLWPPVDLLYISGVLTHKSIALSVIDAVSTKTKWQTIEDWVQVHQPDVIIMLTGTVSFKSDLRELKNIIAQSKKTRVYLVGNTPVFRPEYFLKTYSFVTGIFHHFFDTAILDAIVYKKHNSPSISSCSNGKINFGKVNYLPRLSEIKIPHPPQHHLFPLHTYSTPLSKRHPIATMLTAFGCPFTCKFCIASALDFYPRNVKDLEIELDSMKKNGVKEIFFQDSTFNKNNDHLQKVCRLLKKKKYDFTWSANVHSFNLTIDNLNLMKSAGCHTVQIGVESGSQDILNQYAPSKRKEQLERVFHMCRKVGIRTLGYFIIGFPTETKDIAKETINFALSLNPDFASFSVLTPDYGTRLYDEAIKKKMIETNTISFDSSDEAVLDNNLFPRAKQNQMITSAYRQFYLHPRRIITYIYNYKNWLIYLKNGIKLFKKKLLQ